MLHPTTVVAQFQGAHSLWQFEHRDHGVLQWVIFPVQDLLPIRIGSEINPESKHVKEPNP